MNTVPMFLKLRAAYFHEDGYNLDTSRAAPNGLKKTDCAMFVSNDENGKPFRMAPVPGCEGVNDPQILITLKPWPDAKAAQAVLRLACDNLSDALSGDEKALTTVAVAWHALLSKCLPMDSRTQFAAACNLWGKGRVHDTLNQYQSVAPLGAFNVCDMGREALNLLAA